MSVFHLLSQDFWQPRQDFQHSCSGCSSWGLESCHHTAPSASVRSGPRPLIDYWNWLLPPKLHLLKKKKGTEIRVSGSNCLSIVLDRILNGVYCILLCAEEEKEKRKKQSKAIHKRKKKLQQNAEGYYTVPSLSPWLAESLLLMLDTTTLPCSDCSRVKASERLLPLWCAICKQRHFTVKVVKTEAHLNRKHFNTKLKLCRHFIPWSLCFCHNGIKKFPLTKPRKEKKVFSKQIHQL